jgi:BirA family biotin operon repressor/biotin-[acetyl-CoA-carboxylase] ligase
MTTTGEQENPDRGTGRAFKSLDINLIKKSLLCTNLISDVYYIDETDSTNTLARKININNVLIITEYQTNGRGRFGRSWLSEKAKNLLFTIKQTSPLEPIKLHYLNFYYSYLVYKTIRDFITENNADASLLKLKWPNDVLCGNKKISGILIETTQPENIVYTGIGININQEFDDATNFISLRQIPGIKGEVDRTGFLIRLLNNFCNNLHLLESGNLYNLYHLWKKATDLIGKEVLIYHHSSKYRTKIIDLLQDGGIKLNIGENERIFYSSDITISLAD